jgi:nucleoside-diphosphate-sugar epimerase
MRVFVAGAAGAIGRRLVPQLLDRGHDVVGSTRSEVKAQELRDLGAEPVILDVLDEHAVHEAFAENRPDAVIHEATALSGSIDYRHFDRGFAQTNRLRTAGTDALLAAAHAVGVRRFVAQSFTSWPYAREGGPIKTEEDPLDPDPPSEIRETLAAIRHVERKTLDADGIALRYGGFYGSPDDAQIEAVRRRRFPIVGSGDGITSFVHLEDAAGATVLAVESDRSGIYNVVDDEPAPAREWLPVLAATIGAKAPRHVPTWLARRLAGDVVVAMMTESRGASNAKAKRELGWKLRYPTWRRGFVDAYRTVAGLR